MKLLFDENLPPVLARWLAEGFPGSLHVRECGLKGKADVAIWEYARARRFVIVSKDADFYAHSLLRGAPPKLIWLQIGNCTRDLLRDLLIQNVDRIRAFETANEQVLVLT